MGPDLWGPDDRRGPDRRTRSRARVGAFDPAGSSAGTASRTGGSVGAAEAYVAGDWSTPDLVALLRFFTRNVDRMNEFEDRFSWVTKPALKGLHWLNRNTKEGSRKNISAHYDLGNDLFETFLDPTMMYSSAIYPRADATLEEAAVHKLDTICRKLDLQPGDKVIEIGTGWGGFAYGSTSCSQTFGLIVKNDGDLTLQGWCDDFDSNVDGTGAGWLVQSAAG